MVAGMPIFCSMRSMARSGVAERHAGRQIEGDASPKEIGPGDSRRAERWSASKCVNGAQRNLSATGWVDIDVVQALRALPELRAPPPSPRDTGSGRVHGGNLRLSKGLIERVVDQLRGDSQSRGRRAVVDERGLQAAILLVGVDVGEAGQLSHLLQKLGPIATRSSTLSL